MKAKYTVAMVLIIIGTNLFVYATTRYQTTRYVLTSAEMRLKEALKKEGLYEKLFPSDRPQSVPLILAIPLAGGMYYWWNDGLPFWTVAVILIFSGLAVTRFESQRRK